VILNWLIDQAARAEVHLAADFRRTDRNRMMEIAYRFAGFTDEACGCIAALGTDRNGHRDAAGPGGADTERMHLIPARRSEPATMRLMSPDLASYARG
jgi:methoxymalonate biosynthesis protein